MKTTYPTLLAFLLLAPLATPYAADTVIPLSRAPSMSCRTSIPASCGWLTDWSTERNYCANSYFDHLDRVRDDANYNFALSECNNLIAMLNFRPDRFAELKQRIREGRVELCNAFFLEPTINLSGGEALVKCGVEGLRWQQAMLGVRPRLAWMIDVTGMHEQMAQISAGLGLDGFAYCRHNPTGYAIHWAESPDGTRSLAVAPGRYADWRPFSSPRCRSTEKQLARTAGRPPVPRRSDAADAGGDRQEREARRAANRGAPRSGAPLLLSWRQRRLQPRAALQAVSDRVPPAVQERRAGVRRAVLHAGPVPRRRPAGHPVGRDPAADDARRHDVQLQRVLDPEPAREVVVSPLRTAASGRRDARHRRQPARAVRVSRAGALPRLAADVPEHGPQHALGRGRRHGVRARTQLGRARPLRVGRENRPRHRHARRPFARRSRVATLNGTPAARPKARSPRCPPPSRPNVLLRQARSRHRRARQPQAQIRRPRTARRPGQRHRRRATEKEDRVPPTTWWTGPSATAWPIRASPRRSSRSAPAAPGPWWKRCRRSSAAAVCGAR